MILPSCNPLNRWIKLAIFTIVLLAMSSLVYRFYVSQNQWKNEIWIAMDTFFEYQIPSSHHYKGLKEDLAKIIHEVDLSLNSYHKESELTQVNQAEMTQPVTVSKKLWLTLLQAKELWNHSNGLFDPTFQTLQDLYGFHSGSLYVPDQEELDATLQRIGFDKMVFFEESHAIQFLQDDLYLNFSAIVKGIVLDKAAEFLESNAIDDYLLNFGGSMKVSHSKPQTIQVQHPRKRSFAGSVKVSKGSVSTSSDSNQYFIREQLRYSHIVNPVTGSAQNPLQSATVIHPDSATIADALSTILILMEREEAALWMQTFYPEVGYVLIDHEGVFSKNIHWTSQ